MAAKIIANLLIVTSGYLARGLLEGYRKALANAAKSGVAQETLQNAVRRGSKVMTENEARQILGLSGESSWDEILQKYDNLFEKMPTGAFTFNQKFTGPRECLETVYRGKDQGTAA